MTYPSLPEAQWQWQAGPRPYCDSYSATQMLDYAAAAVAAERERCAKLCEELRRGQRGPPQGQAGISSRAMCYSACAVGRDGDSLGS